MNEATPIKVMVVDDHPIVRSGLRSMLLAFDDLQLIGEAGSGEEILALCRETVPDVILMDIVMPGMDGIAATRAVLDQNPELKIIALTTFPDEDLVQNALEAGVVGYLLKNTPIDGLADAIRSARAGKMVLASEATQALVAAMTQKEELGSDLSDREREVLAHVVQGLSNNEIANLLAISPATVKHHVSACMSKLGSANRAQAAAMAVEYKLIP